MADAPSVYVEWMDIDTIPFAETNPKKHDIGLLSLSLKRYGAVATPILNEQTGRLVVGHGRIEALRALKMQGELPPTNIRVVDGKWYVPVLRGNQFKNEQEAAAYLLDDNSLTLLGGDVTTLEVARMWDTDGYTQLLASLATQDALPLSVDGDDLDLLLDMALKENGNGANGEEDAAGAEAVDRADELQEKWQVRRGDIWEIPSGVNAGKAHRIMCGDSTSAADVEKLMGADRARLVWTDPLYGVKYGDKLDAANPMGYRVRSIQNDDLKSDELENLIRSAFTNAAKFSAKGAAIYAASPAGTLLPTSIAAFGSSGFEFRWGLVWVKDQLVLGRGDYHFKHENILYGWKNDGPHYFIDDRTQTSVFEYPRPKVSEEHPTMKPIALVERMIQNSSQRENIVYDPFLGSGTTLVVSENLGRLGRGMDIEEKYMAVCLERLSLMGLEPKRVVEGKGRLEREGDWEHEKREKGRENRERDAAAENGDSPDKKRKGKR